MTIKPRHADCHSCAHFRIKVAKCLPCGAGENFEERVDEEIEPKLDWNKIGEFYDD